MSTTAPYGNDLMTLRGALDQLWGESFAGSPFRTLWARPGTNGYAAIPLDVYTTKDAFIVLAAVPGLRSEDLEVTYNQGTVVLSGTIGNVAEAAEAKDATWYLHELWHGRFQRAITPPFEVDADRTEATFQDGVLRITMPKAEHAKPRRIAVRMTGAGTEQAETQPPAIEAEAGAAAEKPSNRVTER